LRFFHLFSGFKVTVTSQGAASGVAATSEPTARIVDASAHMAFKPPGAPEAFNQHFNSAASSK
jgi:hypothetical protein